MTSPWERPADVGTPPPPIDDEDVVAPAERGDDVPATAELPPPGWVADSAPRDDERIPPAEDAPPPEWVESEPPPWVDDVHVSLDEPEATDFDEPAVVADAPSLFDDAAEAEEPAEPAPWIGSRDHLWSHAPVEPELETATFADLATDAHVFDLDEPVATEATEAPAPEREPEAAWLQPLPPPETPWVEAPAAVAPPAPAAGQVAPVEDRPSDTFVFEPGEPPPEPSRPRAAPAAAPSRRGLPVRSRQIESAITLFVVSVVVGIVLAATVAVLALVMIFAVRRALG